MPPQPQPQPQPLLRLTRESERAMNDRNNDPGFGSRSGPLELYKLLVDEVNKAVEKSSASLLAQLKSATESMERKADDNFRLLNTRIEEIRQVSRGENERVVEKIDHIVEVLSEGNARFAVIEQRVTTIESKCDGESRIGRSHRPPADPYSAPRPAPAPAEEKKSKANPFVVALLGAVAAALGGAITTWIISGGLTVTPHNGGAAISAPKTP